jgi:DNA (cytosine-5)-methyltransferase 1
VKVKSKRERRPPLKALSLFTGAGGLDLGLEKAGFRVSLCIESDPFARASLAANRPRWKLAEPLEIEHLPPFKALKLAGVKRRQLDLLAGGPPCQPFSVAGYWADGDSRRMKDPRAQTLRHFLVYVEYVLPRVVLIENVKGIAFSNKSEAVRLIRRRFNHINRAWNTKYRPQFFVLNAANYGVPQYRERVFVIADRGGRQFQIPLTTHGGPTSDSRDALEPFHTAWDAIGDLDGRKVARHLKTTGKWAKLLPSIPEGQNYLWHTRKGGGLRIFGWRTKYWSFLLKLNKKQPSWTLQAQAGPATGPFHWRNRRLSTRELCRIQTFPDSYRIVGSYRTASQQIGNAVPPLLGELLGIEIRRQFFGHRVRYSGGFVPTKRRKIPPKQRTRAVSAAFRRLVGRHKDHPGNGHGPRASKRANVERRTKRK